MWRDDHQLFAFFYGLIAGMGLALGIAKYAQHVRATGAAQEARAALQQQRLDEAATKRELERELATMPEGPDDDRGCSDRNRGLGRYGP